MKIEDIDKEFKELAQSLKDGQAAFVTGRFKDAEPLYKRALQLLEASYGEEHSDTAMCLQNLADCYYNQKKYGEAIPLLRRLLIIQEKHQGVSHPDVATTLFKLAKVYEKSGMPKESESFYRRALKVGEQAYGRNHQFVGTILESFAAMLKRAQMRLPEAAQMEERLREMREIDPHASGRQKAIGQNTSGRHDRVADASGRFARLDQNALDRAAQDQNVSGRYNIPEQNVSTSMRSLKSATERMEPEPAKEAKQLPMAVVIAGMAVFILVTAAATILLIKSLTKDGKISLNILPQAAVSSDKAAVKTPDHSQSHEYSTANGLKRLVIKYGNQALMLRNGIVMNGSVLMDDHTITFTPNSQSIKYTFTKVPGGISDNEDSELYARDSGEAVIIAKMQILAILMQQYYKQMHRYPTQIDEILSANQHIVYKNPWSKLEMVPAKKTMSPAADLDPEFALPTDISQVQVELQNLLSPSSAVIDAPGTIEWFHTRNTAQGEVVYIRGTGSDGKLITTSRAHAPYVIQLVSGRRNPE